ncbi:hypothetical protein ABGB17_20310 [Sphaerisporangium sp. B11E5]|uniref:hypothetical protein n=1 Tax=Sphaerisporangium sp. B11E5 TaxID=3153563 RepID=UPI00325C4F96
MSEFTAGDVIVPVVPSAGGFVKDLRKQLLGDAYDVGRDIGAEVSRGIRSQLKALPVDVVADTTRAARDVAKFRAELDRLPGVGIEVDADTSAADAALDAVADAVDRLDGRRAEVDTVAEVGDAVADLATVEAAADRVDGRTVRVPVEVEERGFAGGLRQAVSRAGAVAADALSGALGAAAKASGPVLTAALVAVAAGAGVAAAAALGGALVLGLGGAFTAIGISLLLANDKIKKSFSETAGEIKKIMTDAARPLVPVIQEALDQAKRVVSGFKDTFREAFLDAQGPLKHFLRDLGDAFLELKPAVKPLMDAFTQLLGEIGPELKGIFRDIGVSFSDLARSVGENKTAISAIFTGLLRTIPLVIGAITKVVEMYGSLVSTSVNAAATIARGFANASDAVTGIVERILGAIRTVAVVLGKVPGMEKISGQLVSGIDQAIGKIRDFRAAAEGVANAVELKANIVDLQQKIDKAETLLNDPTLTAERRAQLTADITRLQVAKAAAIRDLGDPKLTAEYASTISANIATLQSRLRDARIDLQNPELTKERQSKLVADISRLLAGVQAAREALATLKDKTVHVEIVRTTRERLIKKDKQLGAERGGIMRYAHGGIAQYATGGIRDVIRNIGPHIATGPTLLFGEGRDDEGFVPYDRRFRPRATKILGTIANDFGYQLIPSLSAARQAGASVMAGAAARTRPISAPSLPGSEAPRSLMRGTVDPLYSGVYSQESARQDRHLAALLAHESRTGQGGGPLVNVEHMQVTPEQSPMGIARDLRYLLGSQVRQK